MTDANTIVLLSSDQLADLVTDQITPVGLMTAGLLDMPTGGIGDFLDWWLVLRSVLDSTPIHSPGSIDLPDDLHRSFTPGDDPGEMRAFLEQAGFLHVRGVFERSEMETISADMDTAVPHYRVEDGRSWWARVADGSQRLVRMQGFESRSPTAAALLEDPRFVGLGEIPGCNHQPPGQGANRVEALFKPIGVMEGISDVPWHKDCSLGRHSYECCALTVGVSVTGADAGSGQLHVIAGSHRALVWPSLLDPSGLELPDVALPTETGDVTVHLSCTLHMAQPPVDRERRVLYTGFSLPQPDPGAAAAANRRLGRVARERAPLTTSQQPAGVSGPGRVIERT